MITKQEVKMEFCPNLDMLGEYFNKALQESQFLWFSNIILGIHEYNISFYNVSRRSLLVQKNIKIRKDE